MRAIKAQLSQEEQELISLRHKLKHSEKELDKLLNDKSMYPPATFLDIRANHKETIASLKQKIKDLEYPEAKKQAQAQEKPKKVRIHKEPDDWRFINDQKKLRAIRL